MFKISCEPIISETQPGARITFAGVHVDVPMRVMRDIRDWWICRIDDLDEFYRRAGVGPGKRPYTPPKLSRLDKGDPRVQEMLKSLL